MALTDLIFDMNPWWRDRQSINQDKHILTFEASKIRWHPPLLKTSLQEDALHIIKGPRQVGKTTLIKLFIKNLLAEKKVPKNFQAGGEKGATLFYNATVFSSIFEHYLSSNKTRPR